MVQVSNFMSCHVMSCHVMSCRHYYRLSSIFCCINQEHKHNNKTASAPCIKFEKTHKGLKLLVIRDDNYNNAEKHNNNVAFALHPIWEAHCSKGNKNQLGITSLFGYGSHYKNYFENRNKNFRNDYVKDNLDFRFDFRDKIYNFCNNQKNFLFNKKIFEQKNKKQGEKKMKKIFLTAIALMAIASAQVFGMYGADSSWIDFLTHGNQFRARLQQLGFTLGNDTIRGTFGFYNGNGANNALGGIVAPTSYGTDNINRVHYNFQPTISMGIGYTSSAFSIGFGYNATVGNRWHKANGKTTEAVAHTPVLVLNALDNAFRMAIPIQVSQHKKDEDGNKTTATAVSLDAQFRYYTGLEIVPQIRLRLYYGNFNYEKTTGDTKDKNTLAESFGFQFRLYFGSVVEEVAVNPYIRIDYHTALGKQHNNNVVTAVGSLASIASIMDGTTTPSISHYEKGAWNLRILPSLGLTANSDIVSLYLEPSLGFQVYEPGSNDKNSKELFRLAYDVYAEIYIRPLPTLEWYFEANIGNASQMDASLAFAASTGITWYLPQF